MPLKKLRISFDIDMPTMLQMLAAGHSSMKIDVYGDDKPPRGLKQLTNGHHQKALPAPNGHKRAPRPRAKVPARVLVLSHFIANPEKGFKYSDFAHLMRENGLSNNSASPQLHFLKKNGYVRKRADGYYHLTAAGRTLD